MADYRTFVVPYDFSAHARAALYTAVDLARRLDASIHLVHVVQAPVYGFAAVPGATVPPPVDMAPVRQAAERSLREVADGIRDVPGKLETEVLERDSIADGICTVAAEREADLVVMGTHGRTGLAHVFLGSVAERTLRHAPCPVLTVQAPPEEEDG